jgi:allantoicase
VTAQSGSPDCDDVPKTPNMGGQLTSVIDLASRWLGGSVLAASDESFGDKDNLLNPGPATYQGGRLGNRGEIVDGWETRRRRQPGYDWAIVRLGAPGRITTIQVDTSFFTGNFPESCRVEACGQEGYPGRRELDGLTGWVEVVPQSPLEGDRVNVFPVCDSRRFTHVRLSIFPDGGVARLRVSGQVLPDPRQFDGVTIDLASEAVGGALVSCSDDFYTSPSLLIRPDEAGTMGDGWEARRRRGPGNDFAIFQLGLEGDIRKVVVETIHFRYNASGEIAVQRFGQLPAPPPQSDAWEPLVERTIVQPDTNHVFMVSSRASTACVRLDAFPDGGLSRFRLIGWVDPAARSRAGYVWFNALPPDQATHCLTDAGITGDLAARALEQRPLATNWLSSQVNTFGSSSGTSAAENLRALAAMLEGPANRDGSR